jgi:leucyl aminopeptidase (aminopeptidase T)
MRRKKGDPTMSSTADRLARNARITIEAACRVAPGETLVICTRRGNHRYAPGETVVGYVRALSRAADDLGAHPVVLDISEFVAGSAYADGTVLEPISAALRSADVVLNTMDDVSFARLVGRDDNDDEFLTARGRWFFLQANGMDEWNLDADEVAAIRPRTEGLIRLLEKATDIHVTSPGGTDFHFQVGPGSNATPILGIVPLYGEVAIAPRQGSEHGTIVVDGPTQMGVRTQDELDREPMVIHVADGHVTDFSGDAEQIGRLKAFIASGDPVADAIDEVGILTTRITDNDRFWWSDGTHHSDTVHIALGNNLKRDTHVHGARHMDTEVIRPSILIDGRVVVKDSVFQDDVLI